MILALDSSAAEGSVALVDGDRVVRMETAATPRGRGGALFSALETVLRGAGPITRVVVGIGPGSYNGIRAAVAAGWGIATAHKVPLVGLSSLLALDDGDYCAVGDARRGQWYFARIHAGAFVEEPGLVDDPERLKALAGAGRILAPAPVDFLPGVEIKWPSAARLAALGQNAPVPAHIPEPLYLKPAFITAPRGAV